MRGSAALRDAYSNKAPKHRVVVSLAADYGNLGDLAITEAQVRFLRTRFPASEIIRAGISDTFSLIGELKATIRPGDLITLVGGGNTGDMYDDIETLRQLIIITFPANPIIGFPQSISFSKSLYGRVARLRAQIVYRRHSRLVLMARDSTSQELFRETFPNLEVVLAPDIALTLDAREPAISRDSIILTLRDDEEASTAIPSAAALGTIMREFGETVVRDTHVDTLRVSADEAREILEQMLGTYRSARLVVTDRLHGMIFAVITGTPVIVFDNSTHKLSNFVRTWFEGVANVQLADASLCTDDVRSFLARADASAVESDFSGIFSEAFASAERAVGFVS